ncbi:MAG: chemotaxis protein CheA [Bosea sp. (in: a-proteobacteria)]|uniref:chemotaxis protein CheA n=1 Tax=Bosea sp. (in: a-proteobacteria) TaxID=1871050 RepID=UPI0027365647|nr:chemotaxis protein CheA [Bosea sp. (in: a-proteobacteria)]MDP3254684.1 chemotaxis protein CheA [Bosea sp. (in: a-proteobacteria)]MDP3321716.1 chemotaxis protein CheA [Bosea sp. (in: a-proteobacteria)]
MMELDPTETFRQEASELLDSLETVLLDLGQTPQDRDLIDAAFRALHTIKGSGAMFGFDKVAAFTHDFETAFDLIRKGKIDANHDIVTVSLSARDYIRTLIEDPDSTDPIIGEAIVEELQRLIGAGPAAAKNAAPAAETAAEPAPGNPASAGWRIEIAFEPGILRNGTNPLVLLDDLRALGPCTVEADLGAVPVLEELDPETCLITWTVTLESACSQEEIEDVFMFVRDEMKLVIAPLAAGGQSGFGLDMSMPGDAAPATATAPVVEPEAAPAPAARAAAPAPAAPAPEKAELNRRAEDKGTTTVRVQAERLDELMDRVGELVIAQARLSQIAHSGTDLAIKAIAEEIERLASGLRDSTMGVRMVPMGSLFGRFRRLVHDLSRDLGKPVDFVTVGEDTEMDKTMIERLADPLVHLIRNAIDHGIENADDRARTAKSATGRIELAARYVGAQVLVTVQDDGAGLNTARIRAKAEENGLIAPGANLSEHEIHQFLFHPGFSTAKTISALSGRGVGMDVVKRTIEAMRGTIDLTTIPGHGSSVTLRLPLTLAIIDGLLIRVGEGRYIIPLSAVEECIELTAEAEARAKGRSFLNVRGDLVPFLRLRDVFDAEGQPDPHQKVIVTSIGDTRVGLVVDQIIGSHQTVIKSLSKLHSDVTMFSGATILGDGSAALILDVAQLVTLGQSRAENDRTPEAA